MSVILGGLNVSAATLNFVTKFANRRVMARLGGFNIGRSFVQLHRKLAHVGIGMGTSSRRARVGNHNPVVTASRLRTLCGRLSTLARGSALVLTNDVPSDLPDSVCRLVVRHLRRGGVHVMISTAGSLLAGILPCGPFLVGPGGRRLDRVFKHALSAGSRLMRTTGALRRGNTRRILVSVTNSNTVLISTSNAMCADPTPGKALIGSINTNSSVMTNFVANCRGANSLRRTLC